MESRVDERISEWINELDTRFVQTGKEFDFAPWTTFVLPFVCTYTCMLKMDIDSNFIMQIPGLRYYQRNELRRANGFLQVRD